MVQKGETEEGGSRDREEEGQENGAKGKFRARPKFPNTKSEEIDHAGGGGGDATVAADGVAGGSVGGWVGGKDRAGGTPVCCDDDRETGRISSRPDGESDGVSESVYRCNMLAASSPL